jgi:hypothetical protein
MTKQFLFGVTLLLCLLLPQVAQSQAGRGENLLSNGDFTFWLEPDGAGNVVAAGWSSFLVEETDAPVHFQPGSLSPTGSGQGQSWLTPNGTAFAGIYQTVHVTPETTVRLSARTNAWSGDSNTELISPAWVRQRIGVDPYGGSDPKSRSIIWSMPSNFVDRWGELSVETRAAGEQVTVFLAAHPAVERTHNQIFYDSVRLTAVSYPLPAVVSSGPTPVPTTDPLLSGLVVGSGVLPGQQGISSISRAARDMSPAETALTPLPIHRLGAFLLVLIVTVSAIFFTHHTYGRSSS